MLAKDPRTLQTQQQPTLSAGGGTDRRNQLPADGYQGECAYCIETINQGPWGAKEV
jgi:hypothetical protein